MLGSARIQFISTARIARQKQQWDSLHHNDILPSIYIYIYVYKLAWEQFQTAAQLGSAEHGNDSKQSTVYHSFYYCFLSLCHVSSKLSLSKPTQLYLSFFYPRG